MASKMKCTLICRTRKYTYVSKKIKGYAVIKFDSNYIGNQHWCFHFVGGVQGLRVAILSVKGTWNEGVPLPFFEVRYMKSLSSLHRIRRGTMVQFTFILML